MKTLFAAALAVVAVSGCAGAERQQQAQLECWRLMADPALDPVRTKIVIGPNQDLARPSLAKQADKSAPDDTELAALRLYDEAQRRCFSAVDAAAGQPPRSSDPRYEHLAALMTGTVSYGDYNRAVAQSVRDLLAERAAERARGDAAFNDALNTLQHHNTQMRLNEIQTQQTIDSFRRIGRF